MMDDPYGGYGIIVDHDGNHEAFIDLRINLKKIVERATGQKK
jgi:hypothetical protein